MKKLLLAAALVIAAYGSAYAGCHTDQYATTCYSK